MKTVTFTEFRKHASALFSDVQEGEIIHVVRHGRPIAEISPLRSEEKNELSWKKPGLRLSMKGESISKAILEERECS